MKETTVSVFQKLIVIILAVFMFMTMVPVGLFPGNDTPSPEGSFVRYFPDMEVYADSGDRQIRQVNKYKAVYYKFNIGDLSKVSEDEIKEINLRLAFLKGSGERNNVVYISKVLPESIPENSMGVSLINDRENVIARITPNTFGTEDFLFEADMTEYVKSVLEEGRNEVAIKVTADTDNPILMASKDYLDVAYRPCLKAVTGIAEDTDADTLKKAELIDAAYVSEREKNETGKSLAEKGGSLLIGDGNEAYLRFTINKNAIIGSLYSARISINLSEESEPSKIRVYSLNNDEWSGDTIKYSDRPRGEEKTLTYAELGENRATIDVTQQVCEAVSNGMYDITFRLVGVGENIVRAYGKGDFSKEPRLNLKATDDKNICCASEAALNALGGNNDTFVTMDLLNSYTGSNGERAKISWSEYTEDERLVDIPQYINKYGEINRPKWFENPAKTLVVAEIQSGDYVTKRRYELNLPAENKPDYTGYKFGNYIDIGGSDSEKEQKFEYVNMSGIKRRWMDGRIFTYRSPEKNSVMVLNLECSPYEVNYLTLKLWQGDVGSPERLSIKPYGYAGDEMVVDIPDFEETYGGEVLYLTYALPKGFTQGQRSVSLCVRFEGFENRLSRGLYGVYMTQNPYFEPKQFVSQGEDLVSGDSFADDAVDKFIGNLRRLFKVEEDEMIDSMEEDFSVIKIDKENKSLMLSNEELNIALMKNEDNENIAIYQKTDYYDRYCADGRIEKRDDISIIDYGIYKIIINSSGEEAYNIGELNLELSGMYKDMAAGEYYAFNTDDQAADDSMLPDNKSAVDGNSLSVLPESALILKQISGHMQSGKWRVSGINGRSVAELVFTDTEKIELVSVKAVGGITDDDGKIKVICAIYENGKLIGIKAKETEVFEGINEYSLSFAEEDLYMNKNRSIRVFVATEGEDMKELMPKLELPL